MSKTVLISGASGGIGFATSKIFLEKGYSAALLAFSNPQRAEILSDEFPSARVYQVDISNPEQVKEIVSKILDDFGNIDILVHCAGIAEQKLFTDITDEDWYRMISTNLSGAFYLTRALLPNMISRKEGKIIYTSSIWGMVGASCEVHYSASKAGLIGMTKALAKELAPSNIQVNCITPGVINTPMNACFSNDEIKDLIEEIPLGRMGTPREIAGSIYFLASDHANYITGQVISPNGGFVI